MNRSPSLLALVLAPLLVLQARPQEREDELRDLVESLGARALAEETAGLALAVDVGGELVLARGFGVSDPERGAPGDEPAIFRGGGLLSAFLAVGALRLSERGALDLASPIERTLDLPYGEAVTVDRLLTHTSGIPGYGELLASLRRLEPPLAPAPILAWLADGPLEAAPGSCASYSNTNDLLLGLVLEKVSGKTVQELLQAEVFDPAGMADTRWSDEPPAAHEPESVEQEFAGVFEDQDGAPPPFDAESLCTSALDLVRFQRALIDGTLLEHDALRLRSAPALLGGGERAPCGRGVNLTALDDLERESIGGALAGHRVHLAYYPEMDATIAVLGCGARAPVEEVEVAIARALLDVEGAEIVDLPLSKEERARHVGEYYAGCTIYWIVEDDERLVLVPPDGPARPLLHQGGERFVAEDDHELRLFFEVSGGRPVAFVLTAHGYVLRALRLD
jgi:CubicO group peptidase (beta-lactamase class C family)